MSQTVYDYTALLTGRSWWSGAFSKRPVFLTYSFEDKSYDHLLPNGFNKNFVGSFKPFTDAEKAAAVAALNQWAAASGITFLAAPAGQGDIRFGNYDFSLQPELGQHSGFGIYPATSLGAGSGIPGATDFSSDFGGDIVINTTAFGATESQLARVMVHEVGHALGLKHPFEGNYVLDPSLDTTAYTVMSYNGSSSTLGSFDVTAIRSLYGTNAEDGTQVVSWSWNAATATLSQTGSSSADTIRGVESADVISANAGDDHVFGSGGNDTINAGGGKDLVHGGRGNDTILGSSDADDLFGDEGDDALNGGSGDDLVHGDVGNDVLTGEAGDDELLGGVGNDTLIGGAGNDFLYGGETSRLGDKGIDTADYSSAKKSIMVALTGLYDPKVPLRESNAKGADIGSDHLFDIENVVGGTAADTITGDRWANVLKGGAGDDVLDGGTGADTLYGDLGLDTLTGGTGADSFVFDGRYGGANLKTITDFTAGSDTIVLDRSVFKGFTKLGDVSSALVCTGKAAHDSNDRLIYDKTSGALYYDADGLGGHGQAKIAMLDAGLTLHGSDFLIVA